MAYAVYSEDGTMKLCRGMLHREGVMVPVHKYHILKSGRNAGKPMYECGDCWRVRQGTGQAVLLDTVWPLIDRLKSQLGSAQAICDRLGLHRATFSRLKHQERINSRLLQKLIDLDYEIAKELKLQRKRVGEPQVVEAEPLGSILRKWCKEWLIERPKDYQTDFMGPQDYIAEKTGINIRQVGGICNSEKQFVPMSKADAILIAIGKQDLMWNGVIRVVANPQWSLEAYVSYMKERGCV